MRILLKLAMIILSATVIGVVLFYLLVFITAWL